jgi:hypothetical protein
MISGMAELSRQSTRNYALENRFCLIRTYARMMLLFVRRVFGGHTTSGTDLMQRPQPAAHAKQND